MEGLKEEKKNLNLQHKLKISHFIEGFKNVNFMFIFKQFVRYSENGTLVSNRRNYIFENAKQVR